MYASSREPRRACEDSGGAARRPDRNCKFCLLRSVLVIPIRKIKIEGLESQNRCLCSLRNALWKFRSPRGWAHFLQIWTFENQPQNEQRAATRRGAWEKMYGVEDFMVLQARPLFRGSFDHAFDFLTF